MEVLKSQQFSKFTSPESKALTGGGCYQQGWDVTLESPISKMRYPQKGLSSEG